MNFHSYCPTCGEQVNSKTRGILTYAICSNGHRWLASEGLRPNPTTKADSAINDLFAATLGCGDAVRPSAVEAARSIFIDSLVPEFILESSEVAPDGMGGIEFSWREGEREVLLSVTASRPDLEPDIYLMLIDKSEPDRSKRFRTIRWGISQSLVEGISWLKATKEEVGK